MKVLEKTMGALIVLLIIFVVFPSNAFAAIPSRPGAPNFSNVTPTSITLSWGSVANATGYEVWMLKAGYVDEKWRFVIGLSATAYEVKDLTPNTMYDFYIIAYSSNATRSLPGFAASARTLGGNGTSSPGGAEFASSSTYKNVRNASFIILLSETGTYTFPGANVGYGSQNAKTITVKNMGSVATGNLNIVLSGTNANSFTLNKTSISSIAKNRTDTFTVIPKTDLAAGTYTATVTVFNANVKKQFNVSFKVNSTDKQVGTFTQLQSAINNAVGPINIIVTASIHLTKSISISSGKNITIKSLSNKNFTLTAAANSRHFDINTGAILTLENVTLDGGYYGKGSFRGGINNNGKVAINFGATIQKCYAENGGGIDSYNGIIEINGGEILCNEARSKGGGIANKGIVTINGGLIINNSAGKDGGGLSNNRGTVTVKDSEFICNTADYGGGIYSCEGTVTAIDSEFIGNKANYGGGIYKCESIVTIKDSGFVGNIAIDGGGIYNSEGTITISGGEIRDNKASREGGGLYTLYFTKATVSNTVFSGNTAGQAYWMTNATDIATYKNQIIGVTKFSDPPKSNKSFEYAYNNYDISYTKELTKNP